MNGKTNDLCLLRRNRRQTKRAELWLQGDEECWIVADWFANKPVVRVESSRCIHIYRMDNKFLSNREYQYLIINHNRKEYKYIYV